MNVSVRDRVTNNKEATAASIKVNLDLHVFSTFQTLPAYLRYKCATLRYQRGSLWGRLRTRKFPKNLVMGRRSNTCLEQQHPNARLVCVVSLIAGRYSLRQDSACGQMISCANGKEMSLSLSWEPDATAN